MRARSGYSAEAGSGHSSGIHSPTSSGGKMGVLSEIAQSGECQRAANAHEQYTHLNSEGILQETIEYRLQRDFEWKFATGAHAMKHVVQFHDLFQVELRICRSRPVDLIQCIAKTRQERELRRAKPTCPFGNMILAGLQDPIPFVLAAPHVARYPHAVLEYHLRYNALRSLACSAARVFEFKLPLLDPEYCEIGRHAGLQAASAVS